MPRNPRLPSHSPASEGAELSESIINSLPGVYYLYDETGQFIQWNKNFETVTGYSSDEIAHMHPLNFFDTEEQAMLEEKIGSVFKTGSDSVEAHLLTKSREKIPYFFTGSSLLYQGKTCLAGMGIDISERVKTERYLARKNEEVNERMKELNCLYQFSELVSHTQKSLEEIIVQGIPLLLTSYQHPDQTHIRIRVKDRSFESAGFSESRWQQSSEIISGGKPSGKIEIFYTGPVQEQTTPFLREEQDLVNSVADMLGNFIERKRTDAAILESEEKYRYLFHNNPALIFIWDLENYAILEVNETALETYGYTREELMQMTVLDLRPADDRQRVMEFAKNFLASNKEKVKKTWRHLKKNGELMFMDITSHRIDYNGRKAILSLAKDITDQVQAEQEVAKSEQRFRTTLDKMLEGVQIYDRNWNCLYVNDAVTKQGPYSKAEIYAKPMTENYPGIEQTELFRTFNECIDRNEARHIEYEFTFPDGTKKWFELSLQPIPEGLFILSIDITERKKQEEDIHRSEEKRELIMNAALDAIICIDLDGRITFWNPQAEKVFGWAEKEVMGKSLSGIIIPGRYREMHTNGMKRFRETGKSTMLQSLVELSALHRDGKEFPVELVVMPIQQGDESFYCAFIRDITDRKNAQEALQDRNEQLRRLSAYLQTIREEERTHIAREIHDELGQQLTVLKMDIASLKNKAGSASPDILKKTEAMSAMVDDSIRTIRKIITELRPGILDDLGLLAALEWQSREFEQKSGISCQLQSTVTQDQFSKDINTTVFRIFQESLTNIARHAKATRVMANFYQDGNTLVLEIADNGKGISDDRRKNKTSFGLLGMRERAKILNGTFDIKPRPEGGTIVTVKIPLTP